MESTIGIIVASILLLLSVIQVYWLCGGTRGICFAIPSNKVDKLFCFSRLATSLFALLFFVLSIITLVISDVISEIPNWMYYLIGWVFTSTLLERLIIDIKYIRELKLYKSSLTAADSFNLY